MKKLLLILLLLLPTIFAVNVTNCSTVLSSSGAYTLTANITSNASTDCIAITTSDVSLDCANNWITFNSSMSNLAGASGITATGVKNLTIKNCNINNSFQNATSDYFMNGIQLKSVNDSRVLSSSVMKAENSSIYIEAGKNITISSTVIGSLTLTQGNLGLLVTASTQNLTLVSDTFLNNSHHMIFLDANNTVINDSNFTGVYFESIGGPTENDIQFHTTTQPLLLNVSHTVFDSRNGNNYLNLSLNTYLHTATTMTLAPQNLLIAINDGIGNIFPADVVINFTYGPYSIDRLIFHFVRAGLVTDTYRISNATGILGADHPDSTTVQAVNFIADSHGIEGVQIQVNQIPSGGGYVIQNPTPSAAPVNGGGIPASSTPVIADVLPRTGILSASIYSCSQVTQLEGSGLLIDIFNISLCNYYALLGIQFFDTLSIIYLFAILAAVAISYSFRLLAIKRRNNEIYLTTFVGLVVISAVSFFLVIGNTILINNLVKLVGA